jgi:hypothetical protein
MTRHGEKNLSAQLLNGAPAMSPSGPSGRVPVSNSDTRPYKVRQKGELVPDWQFLKGEVCYTYVHPNSYREAYRFLPEWKRKWGNYERRHPSTEDGLPVDPRQPPMTSLEALMGAGWDVADIRDPLEKATLSDFEDRLTRAKEEKFEQLILLTIAA